MTITNAQLELITTANLERILADYYGISAVFVGNLVYHSKPSPTCLVGSFDGLFQQIPFSRLDGNAYEIMEALFTLMGWDIK